MWCRYLLGIASVANEDVQEDDAVDDSCLLESRFQTPKEKPSDVLVTDDLTVDECKQKKLIEEFSDVLSDMSGCTSLD